GRTTEWSRLVSEIHSDYCTDDDEPIPDREEGYSLVMEYRVYLARKHEHDLTKATALQEKLVELRRQQAAPLLALPADTPLDEVQRNRLRTLAVSVHSLGQILREKGNAECVQHYLGTVSHCRRIGDKQVEAIAEFNLGHAYMQLPVICNLNAAETAYQRSLGLRNPNDALGRSQCIKQIGMVHHERFNEARERKEPVETLRHHIQAAEARYYEALRLSPKDALPDLAPIHNSLGNLYADVGQLDKAREHYEQDAQYEEKAGNHFGAGQTRYNMAVMYVWS